MTEYLNKNDDNTQEHKMIEYTVQVDSHYTKWYINKKPAS